MRCHLVLVSHLCCERRSRQAAIELSLQQLCDINTTYWQVCEVLAPYMNIMLPHDSRAPGLWPTWPARCRAPRSQSAAEPHPAAPAALCSCPLVTQAAGCHAAPASTAYAHSTSTLLEAITLHTSQPAC